MFQHLDTYAGDPILTLNESFQQDSRTHKVNLSIGIYFDDAGHLPVMHAVREAQAHLLSQFGPKPYLPMSGMPAFCQAVQHLLFGSDHEALKAGRITTVQTLGGSGALKVGADLLRRYFPQSQVWISNPSWENHRAIFEGAGFTVNTYPYYNANNGGLCIDEMLTTLDALPPRSIVLLHACCHNPTGVDPNAAQWAQIISTLKRRELLPFLDIAYQGFGDGLEADTQVLRDLTDAGVPALIANSFSKNFSLYGERIGGLSAVCNNNTQAQLMLGQMMATVRRIYSSPPTLGAAIVTHVLNDATLRQSWEEELSTMRQRIKVMRQHLFNGVTERLPEQDMRFFIEHRGMFSYTGLSPEQVDCLREKHGVYVLRSGRMCMAGLNANNVDRVAQAFAAVANKQT